MTTYCGTNNICHYCQKPKTEKGCTIPREGRSKKICVSKNVLFDLTFFEKNTGGKIEKDILLGTDVLFVLPTVFISKIRDMCLKGHPSYPSYFPKDIHPFSVFGSESEIYI